MDDRNDRARLATPAMRRHRLPRRPTKLRAPFPDHRLICAAARAAQHSAFRLRVLRRRRRRRHRHRAQLGGARCRRAGAALRRDAEPAAGRRRIVRPQICGADRRPADGRAGAGLAGRRRVPGARPRRRRAFPTCSARSAALTIEEAADARARHVLVPALPPAKQRPCARLRSRAPRGCRRRACAGAHARRAGAHDAAARGCGRARRRKVQPRSAHDRRHVAFARLADGVAEARPSAVCQPQALRRRKCRASTT